jgi:hypothetical protein
MFIHDLDVLLKDTQQTSLYDLSARTYVAYDVRFSNYIVQPDEEMRIDLICFRIYESVEYTDILLSVNEIVNPLNIRAGDVLRYPDQGSLNFFRIRPKAPPAIRPTLVNQGRANIKDPRRLQFIENNFLLPPTLLSVPQSPIIVNPTDITITPIT